MLAFADATPSIASVTGGYIPPEYVIDDVTSGAMRLAKMLGFSHRDRNQLYVFWRTPYAAKSIPSLLVLQASKTKRPLFVCGRRLAYHSVKADMPIFGAPLPRNVPYYLAVAEIWSQHSIVAVDPGQPLVWGPNSRFALETKG